jgi:hypothetical protein
LISILPAQLCDELAKRLIVFGTKRSPKLTKLVKRMARTDSYKEKFNLVEQFTIALGEDDFEVRIRASK